MKVYDSAITERGTERKKVYTRGAFSRKAKAQALRDFNQDKKRSYMHNENIKEFRHRGSDVDYWLRFERATILRFNL